jgi:hypothetical protein
MVREVRRRWVVPACLLVSTFSAPACEDEDDASDSGPESESESGAELVCWDIPDMEACLAETRIECRWDTEYVDGCRPDCPAYGDAASCNMDTSCAWDGNACGMAL